MKPLSALDDADPSEQTIVLSGKLRDGKYRVQVGRTFVGLTNREFELFAQLLLARRKTEAGFTPPPCNLDEKVRLHQTVKCLRDALDRALGPGTGKRLIVHAGRSCYFVDVTPASITVQPSLVELRGHHLAQRLVDDLLSQGTGSSGPVTSQAAVEPPPLFARPVPGPRPRRRPGRPSSVRQQPASASSAAPL